MKRAIVKDGVTTVVDLTPEEISERDSAYQATQAEALANAPYIRLAELDIILPRVVEDVAELTGRILTDEEKSAQEEKETIRASL